MKREKTSNNGRLVLTDFRKLNPKNFLACEDFTRKQLREQIALCSCDGTIFVNLALKESEVVFGIFQNLMPEKRKTLEEFQSIYQKRFPNVHSFDDWSTAAKAMNNEDRIFSLSMLLTSTELLRRKIEREYYGKILTFPC